MSKHPQNLLNLTQAAEAVGVTRKTLYSHIDKGLISITRSQGKRYVDVSELLRHYGDVSLPDAEVNKVTRSQDKHESDTSQALKAMQKELAELRLLVEGQQQLLLEDKQARENQNAERREQAELIEQLRRQLDHERSKGFWARVFKG